jgi:hypothetical protein
MKKAQIRFQGEVISFKAKFTEHRNPKRVNLNDSIFSPIHVYVTYKRETIQVKGAVFQCIERQFIDKRVFFKDGFSIDNLLSAAINYEIEIMMSLVERLLSLQEFSLSNLKAKYPVLCWNSYGLVVPYFEKRLNEMISEYPEILDKLPVASDSTHISFYELNKLCSIVFDYGIYNYGRDSRFIQNGCHWMNEMSIIHGAISRHRTVDYQAKNEEKILRDIYIPILYFSTKNEVITQNLSVQNITQLSYFTEILEGILKQGKEHQASEDEIAVLLNLKADAIYNSFCNMIDYYEGR